MSSRDKPSTRLGRRSTAQEALRDVRLDGRTAIVTGASSGIGVETTRVLALAGADVVMAVRSTDAGERVAGELRAGLAKAGRIEVQELDLADLDSVRRFAKRWEDDGRALDLLINNAGVMATPRSTTKQGFELQLGTNHLGHALLTELLIPQLEASPYGRIVNVSSDLHRRGKADSLLATLDTDPRYERRSYDRFQAYGDSKLANVLFTRSLAKRLQSTLVYSLHPGVIPTNLSRSMGALGAVFRGLLIVFSKSIAQGAATTVYAATAPELESRTGAYLSDCAEATASPAGRDDALAAEVMRLTERLTGQLSK
ncbi:MAG: SDR family oxidoreductase [Polyangiaceae bacterium]